MTNSEIFELLQDYVYQSRSLRLLYFPELSGDLQSMDLNMRQQLSVPEEYERIRLLVEELPTGEILSLQDWLGIHFILFREPEGQGFYAIGPFRAESFSAGDEYRLSRLFPEITDRHLLRNVLRPIPTGIQELEGLILARQVLQRIFGLSRTTILRTELQRSDPAEGEHAALEYEEGRAQSVDELYQHQDLLMVAISAGDYNRVLDEANFFINLPPSFREIPYDLESNRVMLYSVNTICRLAAQRTGIPPVDLENLFQKYNKIISGCLNREQLVQTYLDMLAKYCVTCRDFPARNCSPTMRRITNYIHLHLGEELTMEMIARAVNFSPAYIIKCFREELHTSPVTYINAQRIRIARQLLANSNQSIHEIAQYVGIPDWNYFTKVFKKETGLTPSAYRSARSGRNQQ